MDKRTTTRDARSEALGQLDREADALGPLILRRFHEASPEYAGIPDVELLPGIVHNVHRAVAALRERRGPSEREIAETEALAELRARQGIGVDVLLVAYRLGAETAWGRLVEIARTLDVGTEELLGISEELRRWADELMVVIARAHRRVDVEVARSDHERRAGFVRALLAGALEQGELRSSSLTYGLDPNQSYVTVAARVGETAGNVERALLDGRRGLLALVDRDIVGVLDEKPRDVEDLAIGIGPRTHLNGAPASFGLAKRALATAIAFGRTGTQTVEDLGPLVAVAAEREIGEALVRRYLEPLRAQRAFGQELLKTLATWLHHGTSIERSAAALYVHRNTLRHRLGRYAEITGANLADTDVLVEIWWALKYQAGRS